MRIIAENIANASSVSKTSGGDPYQRHTEECVRPQVNKERQQRRRSEPDGAGGDPVTRQRGPATASEAEGQFCGPGQPQDDAVVDADGPAGGVEQAGQAGQQTGGGEGDEQRPAR